MTTEAPETTKYDPRPLNARGISTEAHDELIINGFEVIGGRTDFPLPDSALTVYRVPSSSVGQYTCDEGCGCDHDYVWIPKIQLGFASPGDSYFDYRRIDWSNR
jgi:hypothetical protein